MNTAQRILSETNPRTEDVFFKVSDNAGIVREQEHDFAIYEFPDNSIIVDLDGELTAYESIKRISA